MTGLPIAVVGASAAGLAAAEALRRFGWRGPLTLIGDEPHLPYDRPPLSKQLLHGAWTPEKLLLRTADQLAPLDLDLRLGTRATGLDVAGRTLTLDGGVGASPLAEGRERGTLRCAGVIIATGVAARSLPGADRIAGVHTLRTLDDALALRGRLAHGGPPGSEGVAAGGGGGGRRVVIVGNGVLGCEAAAVARELGHEVTLVGIEATPMAAAVGTEVGELLAEEHRARGVRLLTGAVDGFETVPADPAGGGDLPGAGAPRLTAVRLAEGGSPAGEGVAAGGGGGSRLPADLVLLAIGSRPAVDWLDDPALDISDGLRCDAYCAAAPGVYAAGDVARWDHPVHGRPLRFEHRMNATEQGMAAARNLLAELAAEASGPAGAEAVAGAEDAAPAPERRPFAPVPYFWSDQYAVKIQAYGLTAGADRVETTVLDRAARRAVALYGRDGRAVGVLAAGLPPRRVRALRAVIAAPLPWEEARERIAAATAAG
ncbi:MULTISPECIES: NAD(P)/FAD-dependent oxidoreductase [unclassified Streptomyces]|uniref:NAD(P)/FAD-dependent oxidoreductase n=1 Tax=unclassified Streptomyces TaxID=2593676 RepID=UPI00088829A0|nr:MULTISPECIES: FAD-dependent oxidoreductase [unclassified Streptomyces]PBC86319.1 NAD/ferredoxin-dependent reductase-like protein [Streptomyces sp. 2321.6]SDQ88784.1 Reductase C-terminal [Streptomyces sp. KS_16]SED94718.1 Reductase C-terminal [Streptomyces sp. 2133.1]SNC73200.1 Reductase C-terminal [Streptomyces sp. 2114.4]